jgi:hypothetical protein
MFIEDFRNVACGLRVCCQCSWSSVWGSTKLKGMSESLSAPVIKSTGYYIRAVEADVLCFRHGVCLLRLGILSEFRMWHSTMKFG